MPGPYGPGRSGEGNEPVRYVVVTGPGCRPGLRRDGRWREHVVNIRASAGPRARRSGPRSGKTFHGPVHRWTPRSGGGGESGGAVVTQAACGRVTEPGAPPEPGTRKPWRGPRILNVAETHARAMRARTGRKPEYG